MSKYSTHLARRVSDLMRLTQSRPCPDPWHPAPVVFLDSDEPEPPGCPTCGAGPMMIIAVLPDPTEDAAA